MDNNYKPGTSGDCVRPEKDTHTEAGVGGGEAGDCQEGHKTEGPWLPGWPWGGAYPAGTVAPGIS